MQVILAANGLPSLNDVTYSELTEIISKVREKKKINSCGLWCEKTLFWLHHVDFQLKDEEGCLMGVSTSNLLIANSGNGLPVRNFVVLEKF